ncbi:hypothetical protein J2T08_003653 [Neorhizobium galegae]|uniref:hypothetical protein n=1 Tax=Neorhizobium galegae TaxID=399 RepID=UPI002786875C|nr:hypothetical protein [Neorhizobium galegae]MDQ0135732.1 hypothetical protein [Neorhizobium galegae]
MEEGLTEKDREGQMSGKDVVLVDIGTLLRPEILSSVKPHRLLIFQETIDEAEFSIFFWGSGKKLSALVNALVEKGAHVIPRSEPKWLDPVARFMWPGTLARVAAMNYIKTQKHSGVRLFLAKTGPVGAPTRSRRNPNYHGVAVADLASGPRDPEIMKLANAYAKHIRDSLPIFVLKAIFYYFFAGIVVGLTLIFFDDYARAGVPVDPWVAVLAALAAGTTLFLWRERLKLSYGILEIVIGILTSYHLFATSKLHEGDISDIAYLQLAAGLYIMVRGFDNVGKGLIGTPIEQPWRRFFEGPPRKTDQDD